MKSLSLLLAALIIPLLLNACSGGGSSAQVISVNLTGTVRFEDKLYDTSGFTGATSMKPVRHATVELVGDQGVVATSSTDDNGYYTLSGSGSNLYVRVVALTDGIGTSHTVEVVDAASQRYAVSSARLSAGDSTVDLNITLAGAGAVAGVFNILDVYQSAGEFTYSNTLGLTGLPPLQVRWSECSTNGTYTSNAGNYIIIALLGDNEGCRYSTGDTDEYDDDVMWHEYGHYLEYAYRTADNPGGSHTLSDLNQDLRLAWSEGWGDFLSGAVKEWLVKTYPERLSIDSALIPSGSSVATSWYVDTVGTTAFSYDFRSGTFNGIQLRYASNEGSVAKILWGINDDAVMDLSTIWGVFANRLPAPGVTANLESVWDGWLALYSPSDNDKITMRAILNDRQVYYEDDLSEPDNTTATATALRPEPAFYTLFSTEGQEPDFDLVPLTNGSTYLIETYDLHNGADTYLQILDSNGTPILANDDYYETDPSLYQSPLLSSTPDTCRYSSRVLFTPSVPSLTFYAKVSSSPYRLPGAGRFGDYRLAITVNPVQPLTYKCPP